jgi:hypothetical protein
MLNNNLARNLLLAGVIGAGAFAATSAPAAAATYSRCDSYGCYREHCDYDGDNCWREPVYYNRSYYNRSYYPSSYSYRHWACDVDGDNCRWVYGDDYYRRDYRPGFGLSLGFHD